MYRPVKRKQKGGDFTDILPGGVEIHVAQDTMDLIAELSNISSFAQMNTFVEMHSLTPVEISKLLDTLATALINQNNLISENISSIAGINLLIDEPIYGLQAVYESTVQSYSTSVLNYYSSLNAFCTSVSLISTYNASITSLMLLDSSQVSTVSYLSSIYYSFMMEVQENLDILKGQIQVCHRVTSDYRTYKTNYSTNYVRYLTEKGSVSTIKVNLNSAYDNYIRTLSRNDLSIVNALSTTFLNDLSTMNVVSSYVGYNLNKQLIFEPYVKSTLETIDSLSMVSTVYTSPELDGYYSSIRAYTMSTIYGYNARKEELQLMINDYMVKNQITQNTTQSDFIVLQQQIETFFAKALNNVKNEVLSYKYQIQEWSAFIGYIVTQLIIQKTYISLEINSVSVLPEVNIQNLSGLSIYQTRIQTIVNALNTLDVQFMSILEICSNEMTERENYINIRQNATDLEAKLLMNMSVYEDIESQYSDYQQEEIDTLTNIHSYQSQRINIMAGVMTIVTPQIAELNRLMDEELIAFSYTIPEAVPTDNTPFANDPMLYQILPELGTIAAENYDQSDINSFVNTTSSRFT